MIEMVGGMRNARMGWLLVGVGIAIAAVGVLWILLPNFPWGRLPGDIVVERENFSFYFPVVSCLLMSGVLSTIVWLLLNIGRLWRQH